MLKKSRSYYQSGITYVEIMVVVAIIAVISIIAVYQLSAAKKVGHIQTAADEVSLNIRRSQSYALAVRSTGSFLRPYQNGYGVHFETGLNTGQQDASETSYIIFTDYELGAGPGGWDMAYLKSGGLGTPCGSPSQNSNECLEKILLPAGYRISSVELCSTSCSSVNSLDITFLRPNLDAYFCTVPPSSGGCSSGPSSGYAKITISSGGKSKIINIWSTGQIEVK